MAKKFEVMKRSIHAAENIRGFDLQGKKREFSKQGVMYLSDPGEAKHIEEKYGPKGTGDVLVSEINDFASETKIAKQEGGSAIHHYVFTVPEMPWKRVKNDAETD